MEIQCGAIILAAAEVKFALKDFPPEAKRSRRHLTPYNSERGAAQGFPHCLQGVPEDSRLVALHVSHNAACALNEGCCSEKVVGEWLAAALRDGRSSWASGLRILSAACRTSLEDRQVEAWQEEAARVNGTARFTFVELFAGIGGFRLGLNELGGECALAVELDDSARVLYSANHGGPECLGDVVTLDAADVPLHDILTAGFPCQPFAFCNVGNAESTGSLLHGLGLSRPRDGAMAFEVARFLHALRPSAFILENVPNLLNFNDGECVRTILAALEGEEGAPDCNRYIVDLAILDARGFGLAQQRRRLYFVGFRADIRGAATRFTWPGVGTVFFQDARASATMAAAASRAQRARPAKVGEERRCETDESEVLQHLTETAAELSALDIASILFETGSYPDRSRANTALYNLEKRGKVQRRECKPPLWRASERPGSHSIAAGGDLPTGEVDEVPKADHAAPYGDHAAPYAVDGSMLPCIRDILEPEEQVPADCYLPEDRWQKILERTNGLAAQPSGRGGRIARLDGYARTLGSSYRSSDRFSEFVGTAVPVGEADFSSQPPRFFTMRECCRLQGFPESFVLHEPRVDVQDPNRFYHFVGNAVSPPVIRALGAAVLAALREDTV
eukprot:gnl/TRDRNA2_/TRDRNA2_93910_c0_seq1.p1 gnl/TRDRNA2_/TRDRNA2_93910_c0~~gnl/TRDRNA2_/TRDRNA2_93910_c0_seq1.p1  ORF type:complete len:621 (+),score=98.26 gnl/TRDRNA2_/TRDRNA2_93910_c0_seq1:98-1960(+)